MPVPAPSLTATSEAWAQLRSDAFREEGKQIVAHTAPAGVEIDSIEHVRTAHYAAYRAQSGQRSWLVRIGITEAGDTEPADNTGFLGTSLRTPTGQKREYNLARGFASAGVNVAAPERYVRLRGDMDRHAAVDALWLPFIQGSPEPLTAAHWARELKALHSYRPPLDLPVFTNRAKSLARTAAMADRTAGQELAREYDEGLQELFAAATRWSAVHGDAHAGNALTAEGRAVLFDFDTVCWAPSVWDLTHLITRAGTGDDTGFTADEIREAFDFTDEEVDAAVRLRLVAKQIARA